MFGYVVVDKQRITDVEWTLYNAFYCGICKTIKEEYGNVARFFTSYDVAFLSILSHDCLNYPVELKESKCIGSPIKKKPMVQPNPLMRKLAAVAVLLVEYKLKDDVIDGKKTRKTILRLCSKAFGKANENYPKCSEIIDTYYAKLRELEKNGEQIIDRVADCFACMLKDITADVLADGADDNVLSLAYNIGKYVYLIDAVDDIEDDNKKGNYNPYLACYKDFDSRKSFFERHGEEIELSLTLAINKAIAEFNSRRYNQSFTLLANIMYYGLRKRADEVLSGEKIKKERSGK